MNTDWAAVHSEKRRRDPWLSVEQADHRLLQLIRYLNMLGYMAADIRAIF